MPVNKRISNDLVLPLLLSAIADHFKRDPVVISREVRRVEKRLLEDGVFRQSMEKMEKSLIRGKKFKIV